MRLIALYLAAIVCANLLVAQFGPSIAVFNAFALIALDLSTRDALHEQWKHDRLALKMGALIATGSALSWLLNANAGPIALASLVAFAAAGLADTLVYSLMERHPRLIRMNASNIVSAAVDSVVFPTLAFGSLLWPIVVGQFTAKVLGGAVWSWVLTRREVEAVVA